MTVVYKVLHAAVEANLREDFSLIIVATYSRHSSQDSLGDAVRRGGGVLKLVLCEYEDTPDEIERRIAARINDSRYSGGCRSVSHYLADKERYEGIKFPHIVVRMERSEEAKITAIKQVTAYLDQE